jgi:hypothetical protein
MLAGGLLAGGYIYRVLSPALSNGSAPVKGATSKKTARPSPSTGVSRCAAWLYSVGLLRIFANRPRSGDSRRPAGFPPGRAVLDEISRDLAEALIGGNDIIILANQLIERRRLVGVEFDFLDFLGNAALRSRGAPRRASRPDSTILAKSASDRVRRSTL